MTTRLSALVLLTLAASACSPAMLSQTSRNATPMAVDPTPMGHAREAALEDQAQALQRMTADLVQRAMMQGAALGAVAGCGTAALTGGASCVSRAVLGGVIGGAVGHGVGQARAANRVEIVNLSRLLPVVSAAGDQADQIARTLPALLDAQSAELKALKTRKAAGQISQTAYEARLDDMRAHRAALASALSLSASQAAQARRALEAAQAQGQDGVDWYLSATRKVEDQALSARAGITLL